MRHRPDCVAAYWKANDIEICVSTLVAYDHAALMDEEDKYRHGVDCFMVVDQKELNKKKCEKEVVEDAGSKVVERNDKWIYERKKKEKKLKKWETKQEEELYTHIQTSQQQETHKVAIYKYIYGQIHTLQTNLLSLISSRSFFIINKVLYI